MELSQASFRAARGDHTSNQAAVLLFDLAEAGKGRQQTLFFRFGVIDARKQRLGDLVQSFRASAACDKFAEAFVLVVFARRDKEIKAHTQFAQQ